MTELPEQLAAFARAVTGGIVRISDRSWPRAGSAIWEVTDRAGRAWFVKRHSSERFHQREVSAYQRWTAALGPGRAPELAAADGRILAIVITGLPGLLARDLVVPAAEERELHRQAGDFCAACTMPLPLPLLVLDRLSNASRRTWHAPECC